MTNDELRKLAQAATPGPWDACEWKDRDESGGWSVWADESHKELAVADECSKKDSMFIAACDPQTILGQLDTIARQRAALERIGKVMSEPANERLMLRLKDYSDRCSRREQWVPYSDALRDALALIEGIAEAAREGRNG